MKPADASVEPVRQSSRRERLLKFAEMATQLGQGAVKERVAVLGPRGSYLMVERTIDLKGK